ncbi:MAG: periplasmic solute binding family protein [Hyphomicrobiales bacterium]|nr:periplasmic solute binding family protein [Hyphomicrobiales bacterium]
MPIAPPQLRPDPKPGRGRPIPSAANTRDLDARSKIMRYVITFTSRGVHMLSRRVFLVFLSYLLASGTSYAAEPLPVVATFSILGDFVKQVGGEHVDVHVLVGPDGDAHTYVPTPQDAQRVSASRLVVVNGLALEGWLDRLFKASAARTSIIVASRGVAAIPGIDNAKRYVTNIRDALIVSDPVDRSDYETNAADYLRKLDALDQHVREALAIIPASRRKIITTPDAFGYFAKAYGFTFIAPQGISTDSEASAKDVGKIIRQIKAQKIPAVLLENVTDHRLIQQIAKETGAKIGKPLFSDALSPPDGPAGTYIAMVNNNLDAFVEALR